MNYPRIYAVIVSWNGQQWIKAAIESLALSTLPVRTIVVDNASPDDTTAMIKRSYSEVTVLSMSSNRGFAVANNRGIQHALEQGAEYVLLLNQDARVAPDMVEELVLLLDQHAEFGLVSPLHLSYEGGLVDGLFLSFIGENRAVISDALKGDMRELYEVSFVNAAVWLLSRRAIDKVGGFDPIYFMYGEDHDYCCRLIFHGLKIGVAPRSRAYHWHGGGATRQKSFREQYLRLSGQIIQRLKRPDHVFILSCMGLVGTWVQRTAILAIYGDFKGCAAMIAAFLGVVPRLSRIRRQYEQCRRPAGLWL